MPLLWVLRDVLNLTGTKYGCGIEVCGACTVMVDGQREHACVFNVSSAVGKQIVTIEGLSTDRSHPAQQAWIAKQVPQCGFCQSGMLMSTACAHEGRPPRLGDRLRGEEPLRVRHLPAHQASHRRSVTRTTTKEQHRMNALATIDRRQFLGTTASGLTLGFTLNGFGPMREAHAAAASTRSTPGSASAPTTASR